MALEDLTGNKYIDSLVATNPVGSTDPVSDLDGHVQGIKNVLKKSFPSVSGAVTATHTELNLLDGVTATTDEINYVDGVTSNIQDQLTNKVQIESVSGNFIINSTAFVVSSLITEDTFETIGPTGSGATNIWTAMNNIPAGADWVEIKYNIEGLSTTLSTVESRLYAMPTGGSGDTSPTYDGNVIGILNVTADSATNNLGGQVVGTHKIPLDSNLTFKMTYSNPLAISPTFNITIWVSAWGKH